MQGCNSLRAFWRNSKNKILPLEVFPQGVFAYIYSYGTIMKNHLLLVGIGGFIGGIARYLTAHWLTRLFPSTFPYGTFTVNIIGCLFIGIVYGLSERFNWLTSEWRLFLATGICGGYTTFSSFIYEDVNLVQTSNYLTFATYSISSFLLGLLAVFTGLTLAKI